MFTTIGMIVLATAITVRPHEYATNYVESGTSTQLGEVFVSTDGSLLKTGVGKWAVPDSTVLQPQPLKMTVLNGSVAFPSDEVSERSAAFPEALRTDSRLLYWLDASDSNSDHFVGTAGGDDDGYEKSVEKWYDVRETSTTSPTYGYMAAGRKFVEDNPKLMTTNGEKCIYFGGRTSGLYFNIYNKSGVAVTKGIRHVFAVHRVVESLGAIVGSDTSSASSFTITYAATTKSTSLSLNYAWNSEWSELANGRAYLNGERIDPCTTSVQLGLQLLEVEHSAVGTDYSSAIYCAGNDKGKSGGDYLCEMIIFNAPLKEDERIAVQNYLMDKWMGKQCATKEVALKSGTSLVVDGTEKSELRAYGNGTVVKSGSGAYWRDFYSDVMGDSAIDVQDGEVLMGAWMPVKARAGQTIKMERNSLVPHLTVANNAAANQLIKEGTNTIILSGVPEGVKRIDVKAGALIFNAPVTNEVADASENVEIPVADASFETLPAEQMPGGVINSTAYPGWTWGATSGVYDYNLWTTGVVGVLDGASKSDWGANNVPPPDGTRAALVRGASGYIMTEVTLPSGGTYELTCYGCPRASETAYSGIDVALLNSNNKEVAYFGALLYYPYNNYKESFHRYRFRAWVKEGGTYRLRFKSRSSTSAFYIDNIHMVRLANMPERRWQIPEGKFERAAFNHNNYLRFTNGNINAGWTFTEDSRWTATTDWYDPEKYGRVSTGVSLPTMRGKFQVGGVFNNWQSLECSMVMLLIRGLGGEEQGAKVTTTFTPPAGKHYLSALLAGYAGCSAAIRAKVTMGDNTYDLGSIKNLTKAMLEYSWPIPFETDGSTAATLTLTLDEGTSYSRGVFADDFVLSDRPFVNSSVEYLNNGDFENFGNWTTTKSTSGSYGMRVGSSYSEAHWAFGYDPYYGATGHFAGLYRDGSIHQDVTLLMGGRYRLSFLTRGRVDSVKKDFAPYPIQVTVADGITTSIIARTLGDLTTLNSTNWVKHVYDFNVPTGGVYRLKFKGFEDLTDYRETLLDHMSLRQISNERDYTPPFAADTEIRVAEGAHIKLDFQGTNDVFRVRYAGRTIMGVINAETHPEFVIGSGSLRTTSKPGFVLIYQ